MTSLVVRTSAAADLRSIHTYIAADDPAQACRFVLDIRARCDALRARPRLGPAREDLGQGLRIYRATPEAMFVIGAFHGGQDHGAILRAPTDA